MNDKWNIFTIMINTITPYVAFNHWLKCLIGHHVFVPPNHNMNLLHRVVGYNDSSNEFINFEGRINTI